MTAQERDGAELESQFILRLPEGPADELRELIRNPAINLKDRLRLKLEDDLRHGTLYFDHYVFHCKLVDLPCIIESQKSIDNKNFYKTADVAQMLICTEEEEPEEEPKPQKKTNSFKVDKKYLWPHGVTPPLKCARKRRFRRTLKKKQYSDQPEIEKEVRRLLRADYEAGHIRWEVIDDEQEDKSREGGGSGKDAILMEGSKTMEDINAGGADRLGEEHIFGEALSDSDADADADDEDMIRGGELDDESRISMDMDDSQSRLSDSMSTSQIRGDEDKSFTSFKDIFSRSPASSSDSPAASTPGSSFAKSPDKPVRPPSGSRPSGSGLSSLSRDELQSQLNDLRSQLSEITSRRHMQEGQLATMENVALRNRLEAGINQLVSDQKEKERQIQDVEALLSQL